MVRSGHEWEVLGVVVLGLDSVGEGRREEGHSTDSCWCDLYSAKTPSRDTPWSPGQESHLLTFDFTQNCSHAVFHCSLRVCSLPAQI